MITILYTEPVVSEMVGEGKRYLSEYNCPETEVVVTSLPEGPRHLEYYSYGALVVPKLLNIIKGAGKEKNR